MLCPVVLSSVFIGNERVTCLRFSLAIFCLDQGKQLGVQTDMAQRCWKRARAGIIFVLDHAFWGLVLNRTLVMPLFNSDESKMPSCLSMFIF